MTAECPSGHPNPPDAGFCRECGAELRVLPGPVCSVGHYSPPKTAYCEECGEALSGAEGIGSDGGGRRLLTVAAVVVVVTVAAVGGVAAWLLQVENDEDRAVTEGPIPSSTPSPPASGESPRPEGQEADAETAGDATGEDDRRDAGAPDTPSLSLHVEPGEDSADELYEYLSAQTGTLVHLDLYVDDDETLRVDDEDPAVIMVPDADDEREGVQYLVADIGSHTDSSLGWTRGAWRLQGYFAVRAVAGPHQGVMSVSMRAVAIPDVVAGNVPADEDGDASSTDERDSGREGFVLPSRNIYCAPFDQEVQCEIRSLLDPAPTEPCELDWSGVKLAVDGSAAPVCAGDTIRPLVGDYILAYGKSWEYRGIVCHAERTGLTCENPRGSGLFLSRASWRTW